MLVNAHGHIADDIFVDLRLALELGDAIARSIEVEQHEMRLAVALDLVGQALEAPGLGLGDLALVGFDNLGSCGSQRIDLRLAQILARQEDMLVKRHALPFSIRTDRWLIRTIAGPLRLSAFPASFDKLRTSGKRGH